MRKLILFLPLFFFLLLISLIFFHRTSSTVDDAPFFEVINDGINSFYITNVENITLGTNPFYFDDADPNEVDRCTNGKNPNTMSKSEYIKEFKKGPCSPLLIVPGIIASRLQVLINCTLLLEKNPEIFSSCGWNTCSESSSFFSTDSKPSSEYTLWFAEIGSPMSIYSMYKQKASCFGNLMELKFNKESEKFEERYKEPEGIKVSIYGTTPETKSKSECGMSAIGDYMGFIIGEVSCSANGFNSFYSDFKSYGYKSGLTLQAMPYDWRRPAYYNDLQFRLEKTAKFMRELTGKKVIIVAHSMGTVSVLYFLNKMSQKYKDDTIAQFVPIGAPFLGATKALNFQLGGYNVLNPLGIIGVPFVNQKQLFGSAASILDLFPMNSYEKFKDTPWLKDLLHRMSLEKMFPADDSFWNSSSFPFPYYPAPNETCGVGFGSFKGAQCGVPIPDMDNLPLAEIEGKKFFWKQDDLTELMGGYVTLNGMRLDMYKDALKSGINKIENPGVGTYVIFSSFYDTDFGLVYNSNPKDKTLNNEFSSPDKVIAVRGDKTVLAVSSLLPAFKWMWEYDHKKENAKPIKIIEHCSQFNRNKNIYDKMEGERTNMKNGYIGLECKCEGGLLKIDCQHDCQPSERNIKKIVFEICKNSAVPKEPTLSLTEEELTTLENECVLFNYGGNVSKILKKEVHN